MLDRREQILTRLNVIAAGLPGIVTAERNANELNDIVTPAIVTLDADEEGEDKKTGINTGRVTAMVTMVPQMRIILGASGATIGSDLNVMRRALSKAVLTDDQLLALIGANGRMRYHGCQTAFGRGRLVQGDMYVLFAITYPFIVNEL